MNSNNAPTSDATQTVSTPTPFYYLGTDSNPPAGATGYPMTPANLQPALLVWLFLTTNPDWIPQIYQRVDGNPYLGSVEKIAKAVGLTPGTVQYIFDRCQDDDTRTAMKLVAGAFQEIKSAYSGQGAYHPPCPPSGDLILGLADAVTIDNPGA